MKTDLMGLTATRRQLLAGLLATAFAAPTWNTLAQATNQQQGSDATQPPVILIVGDSLSAEYGLRRGSGWVALLEQRLVEHSLQYTVINASISGETTAGGRSRMQRLLERHAPAIVVLELGANDALRGLNLQVTEENLRHMTQISQQAGAQVLMVGMQIPPNYGPEYTERFATLFGRVAVSENTPLVPFLLDGVADKLEYFQADRIHPNEDAQPTLLNNVWQVLHPMLDGAAKS